MYAIYFEDTFETLFTHTHTHTHTAEFSFLWMLHLFFEYNLYLPCSFLSVFSSSFMTTIINCRIYSVFAYVLASSKVKF